MSENDYDIYDKLAIVGVKLRLIRELLVNSIPSAELLALLEQLHARASHDLYEHADQTDQQATELYLKEIEYIQSQFQDSG